MLEAPPKTPALLFVPAPRGLLRDDIYRHLRDRIIGGAYEPGARVRDIDVAAELGVSRTPVREALQRLEDDGLIETWANRWTRVTPVDVDEARRIYPIIGVLERLAVLQAETVSADRLNELDAANSRLREALGQRDAIAASKADRDFHEVLIAAWDNPELVRSVGELKLRLQRLEVHYFGGSLLAERSIDEHQAILDALSANNRAAAANAVEENWRNSFARLRQRSPRPASQPAPPLE